MGGFMPVCFQSNDRRGYCWLLVSSRLAGRRGARWAAVFDLQGFVLGLRGHIRNPKITNVLPFFSPADAI